MRRRPAYFAVTLKTITLPAILPRLGRTMVQDVQPQECHAFRTPTERDKWVSEDPHIIGQHDGRKAVPTAEGRALSQSVCSLVLHGDDWQG